MVRADSEFKPLADSGVRRTSAWLAGLVALVGSIGSALAFLASNEWFGAGDLSAMVVWSLPLGTLIVVTARVLSSRLAAARTIWQYFTLVPVCALVGVIWAIIVALLLGGYVGAFSFPVLFCWIAGATLGGITAAWLARPRSWPAAMLLLAALLVGLGRLNAYAANPEPRVRVVVKPNATPAEVQRVWTEVLGRPTERPGEHSMLPGISSISASGYEGSSAVFTVTFWTRSSDRQRDSLVALILRSPLIARVDSSLATDASGAR